MSHEEFKVLKIYSAKHPTEAHLLKGILESYGILCEVRGEFLFAGRGELPISPETAPSVWILDAARFDEAAAIAADFDHPHPSADPETWACKSCGERSEGQFTECWNCGKPR
jgi:hypothetical protein